MNLPASPVFRPEDFADSDPRLLEALTSAMRELYDSVRSMPDSAVLSGKTFVSAASGVTLVDLANPLSAKPSHVSVSVRRVDATALAAVWSFEWRMVGEQIRLSFLGLPASTRMQLSMEVR